MHHRIEKGNIIPKNGLILPFSYSHLLGGTPQICLNTLLK